MKINNAFEIIEDSLIVFGVAFSLEQIETILGIVILSVQVVLILVKTGIAVYKKVKNKDYTGAIKDVEEGKNQIDVLMDKNKKDADNKNSE